MTEEQLIKYLKHTHFNVQKARASILAMDVCFSSYVNSKATKNVLSPIYTFIRPYDSRAYFYQIIEEEILRKMAREVYENFLNDRSGFYKKFEIKTKIGKEIDNFWKKYSIARKNNLSKKDLARFFSELTDLWNQWWQYASFIEDKGEFVLSDFLPEFSNCHNMSIIEANEIINVLTHPKKIAIFNQERRDYLNLQLMMMSEGNRKKLEILIQKYIKKYFWVKTDFYSKKEITSNFVFNEVKKELTNKKAKEIKMELARLDASLSDIGKMKTAILKKMKLSATDKKYFNFARYMISWQDERKEEMMKQLYYLYSLIEDIAKITNVSFGNLNACFSDEIIKFLKTGKFVYKKPHDLFVVFAKNKLPEIFSGQTARKLLKSATKESKKIVNELKGIVASRGDGHNIIGEVKIISNPAEQVFDGGDILVTSMTRVEFAPLMNKAKAIITDEGGIASHAAIISRELGIPCIIGTKIATQVLKDGDVVEMNLESGFIKIINK